MKKLFGLMLLCATMTVSFTACSDNENDLRKLSRNELSLIAGQNAQLTYHNGDCTWKTDEPLIAEVDDNGMVTAKRIGETTIWANDESCKVTVKPKYNTYMEPCIDWGTSKSSVKSFMNGYDIINENSNTLSYMDYNRGFGYVYVFENNSLSGSIVMTDILYHGEEATDFLLERYVTIHVDRDEPLILMSSIDGKTAIGITFETQLMYITYMPSPVNSTNTESIMPELNKQILQKDVVKQTSEEDNSIIINNLFEKFTK